MNTQEIIVIILILASVAYTVFNFIQIFIIKSKNSCGCSSCNLKTDVKDLKSIVHKKLL
ncbi:MAG: FeoB-associated Cys-rich membrane protein [Bacteroidales bacterium]|nr:FeoB-associated Cys-rich membrane protein [Bacteroidales bacterium]